LSDEGDIDHFLLFDVCEIMSIRVAGETRVGGKRKQPGSVSKSVKLQVGVLERLENSAFALQVDYWHQIADTMLCISP
jgi:hypothetical protein